jgi:hypothetical protein
VPCCYNFIDFYLPPEVSHRKCLREQKYALCAIHDARLEYPYHSLIAAVLRPSHGVLPVELCGFLFTGPSIIVHFLVAHAFEEEEKACPSHVFERYREVDGSGQSRWGHEAVGDILMGNKRLDVIAVYSCVK